MAQIRSSTQPACSDIEEFEPTIHLINDTSARISPFSTSASPNATISFQVEYWHINYLGCTKNESDGIVKVKNLTGTDFMVHYLFPFSQYGIKLLYSENTVTCIKETTFNTSNTVGLGINEKPLVSYKFNATNAIVSIKWMCYGLRGQISRNISVNCASPSCGGETIVEYTKNETISTTDVGFRVIKWSRYILKLNYQRDEDSRLVEYTISITLQEPYTVNNVVLYNVNNTSISLKWLPPDPPTGIIELYAVRYYHSYRDVKEVKVDGLSNCEVWPEYICTTIHDSILLSKIYTFEVRAKNYDVEKFGHYKHLTIAVIGYNVPSRPVNVRYVWQGDQNMIIEWEHPNIPNGLILEYHITINREIFLVYNVTRQRLHYFYEIDPSTYNLTERFMEIRIIALNGIGASSEGGFYMERSQFVLPAKITNVTDSTFDIQFSQVVAAHGDVSLLYVVVTDAESTIKRGELHSRERKLFKYIGTKEDSSWVIGEFHSKNTTKLTVGNNLTSLSEVDDSWIFTNRILKSDHSYNITVLLVELYNGYKKTYDLYNYYFLYVKTLAKENSNTNSESTSFQNTNSENTDSSNTESQNTNPQEPYKVRNIVAYNVNDTLVSLKWLPPDPPTGSIEHYEVRYYLEVDDLKIVKVDGSSRCEIWTEYICTTINDREFLNNETYKFKIRAKNRGVDKFGDEEFLELTTANRTKVPSKPLNINYERNGEEYLIIEWEHPAVPNGQILQFYIYINGKIAFTYKVPIERLNYKYEVDVSDYNLNLDKQVVEIIAVNAAGNSSIGVNFLDSPQFSFRPTIENVTESTFDIKIIPPTRLVGESRLYVVITDADTPNGREKLNPAESSWFKSHGIKKEYSWFVGEFYASNTTKVTVGNNSTIISDYDSTWFFFNRILDEDHSYNVTIVLEKIYHGSNTSYRRFTPYKSYVKTLRANGMSIYSQSESPYDNFNYLWSLLLVPFLLAVICTIIIKRRRNNRKALKKGRSSETESETQINNILDIYYDITLEDRGFTKLIEISELDEYVKNSIENYELTRQYQLLPRGPFQSQQDGSQLPNRAKNRFPDLVAYDETRVKLNVLEGDPFSDYINANYIDGYDIENAYIATQTPTDNTYSDFWRMIWQENVKYIVIAADLNEEERANGNGVYWPDINDHTNFCDIKVVYTNIEIMANYEIRHFTLSCGHQERVVKQLHFFSMPDYSRVPLYILSFASFIKTISNIQEDKSPIVVQCSDGIGYTGIVILCDICSKMAISEGQINVLFQLYKLRKQRINMVSNLEQYKIVHFVLLRILECLKMPTETGIICDKTMERTIQDILITKIARQMKYLEESAWQYLAMREIDFHYDSIKCSKSAESGEPPHSQVYRYWTIGNEQLFITTTIVDGFSRPSKFIVTPKPVNATLGIFWQFIFDKRIDVVLCLNKLSLIADFENPFNPLPNLKVNCINHKISEYFEVYTLYVSESNNKQNRMEVNIVHNLEWPSDVIHPDHPNSLIMTYEEMNRLGKTGRPILITCHNGIQASGLFVAMCFLIEKIKTDHVCDVCLAVKSVRQSRKEYVRQVEQYTFLYLCALEYVRKFKMYSNFDASMNDD